VSIHMCTSLVTALIYWLIANFLDDTVTIWCLHCRPRPIVFVDYMIFSLVSFEFGLMEFWQFTGVNSKHSALLFSLYLSQWILPAGSACASSGSSWSSGGLMFRSGTSASFAELLYLFSVSIYELIMYTGTKLLCAWDGAGALCGGQR
jgi:hypothetical protein